MMAHIDVEHLVSFFKTAMPRIGDIGIVSRAWYQSRQGGYDARMAGKPRQVHARGGNKGMWLLGWDEADKEMTWL